MNIMIEQKLNKKIGNIGIFLNLDSFMTNLGYLDLFK